MEKKHGNLTKKPFNYLTTIKIDTCLFFSTNFNVFSGQTERLELIFPTETFWPCKLRFFTTFCREIFPYKIIDN